MTTITRFAPGVGALRSYQRRWLRYDVVAGVVLAAILVPQGMAYAELAGLPPVTGLYTTIACLVGYALMGPSRVLVLGPDSSVSPLAALSLADLGTVRRYWHVRRTSFVLSLAATAGVVFFGVLEGILIAVALSVLLFFQRGWWPHGEVLGLVQGHEGWHSERVGPAPEERPDVLVYRWEAPLFFANAGMFQQQIRHHVRRRKPRWVVLQCEAITDIDVTAADMLERLDNELNEQGVHLAFVELRSRLQDLVYRYGLFATLDRDHFYDSIDQALRDIDASGDEASDA